MGWLFEKRCRLLKTYPQFTAEFVEWELDGCQGWAYSNWARENEASFFGARLKYETDSYVRQQYNELMDEYERSKRS